mmetsp:Transcript_13947/g.20820  ORF Transcript_13947/g.20820 Transcript_13947/m.20820 type:complete len:152 (+) Transcript_13947:65-520(+)
MNNDGQPRQLQDTDGPQQWYDSLPFVTKHWLTTSVLTTFFTNFGIIPIDKIYYSFGAVKDKFEIWRLITNFAYVGPFEFNTVAYLFMLYKYSANYESSSGYNTGGGGGTCGLRLHALVWCFSKHCYWCNISYCAILFGIVDCNDYVHRLQT